MSEKLREAAQAALDAMSVVRVFVTSKEKIKHPEGTDWYDNIRINLDENIVNNIKEMNAIEASLVEPAIKKTLTVAEQEPVAFVDLGSLKFSSHTPDPTVGVSRYRTPFRNYPLYTAPPRREWVGLTDEEIDTWNIVGHESLREFVRDIEAKLREKNT